MRVGWRGKLVVQVLREIPSVPGIHAGCNAWEDATIMTLTRAMEIAKEKGVPPFNTKRRGDNDEVR